MLLGALLQRDELPSGSSRRELLQNNHSLPLLLSLGNFIREPRMFYLVTKVCRKAGQTQNHTEYGIVV